MVKCGQGDCHEDSVGIIFRITAILNMEATVHASRGRKVVELGQLRMVGGWPCNPQILCPDKRWNWIFIHGTKCLTAVYAI